MRYVGLIVYDLGKQTGNDRADVTDTSGIPDSEILLYLTNAQRRLQSRIVANVSNTGLFDTRQIVTIAAGADSIPIPGDLFYRQKIKRIEISTDNGTSWYELTLGGSERINRASAIGFPGFYAASGEEIVFDGEVQSSCLARLTYVRRLDTLDKRRGKILTVTNDGTNYTSIQLEDDENYNPEDIARYEGDYVCINSRRGVVNYYNADFDVWDSGSRTITFANTPMSAGTISVGDYITLGEYSTTHSKLIPEAEQYLIEFADWKLKKGDSSVDAEESNAELVAIEDDIISQCATTSDLQQILIVDDIWN